MTTPRMLGLRVTTALRRAPLCVGEVRLGHTLDNGPRCKMRVGSALV